MASSSKHTSFSICSALESDLPQIHAIYSYYVRNTTISFLINPPSLDSIASKYHETQHLGLPYLVAITRLDNLPRKVLGSIYAGPFNASRLGYAPSLDFAIYVDPTHLTAGVGTALLTELIAQLKGRVYFPAEAGHEDKKEGVMVRNLYAIVSQDVAPADGAGEESKEGWNAKGENSIAWYKARFGFEEQARLRKVGNKFGRWIDVVYLQKRLDEGINEDGHV